MAACPSPSGGGGTTTPTTYTTTVTGTVTASAPGETSRIDLPGATVSALTTPPHSANQPAASGPDGAFTLQVKHSGSFRIKVDNTCSEPFTTDAVTAAADSHNAGALRLTLKSEPAGAGRYTFTPKGPPADKKFKLTLNCVREIGLYEFNASNATTIIGNKAAEEGITTFNGRANMITEISLPPTLTKIGRNGLSFHNGLQGTLVIPRNVQIIEQDGLDSTGNPFDPASPAPVVAFETGSKLREIGTNGFKDSALKDFTFPDNLETIESGAFFRARFSFSPEFPSPGTLIIPAKVSKIGNGAFASLQGGITTLDIRSTQLKKLPGTPPSAYPLQPNLIQGAAGITEVKLPAEVFDSYSPAELTAIFGSITLTPVP